MTASGPKQPKTEGSSLSPWATRTKSAISTVPLVERLLVGKGGSAMAHAKQASKRKRRKTAMPVLGAAGVSLAMAGGASAAAAPTANLPPQDNPLRPVIYLGEEEISDVSLGTFYVFD